MATGRSSRTTRREATTEHAASTEATHRAKERSKAVQRAELRFNYEDEEDDEAPSSAGTREVGLSRRQRPATDETEPALPLRKATTALHQSMHIAMSKHADALAYIDRKIERAKSQGFFSIKFTFGEVEGLGASSHAEYVAFVQMLAILGYTAKYTNEATEHQHAKDAVFLPQTVIHLDWLPQKK
jgi:hypothetical protein